MHVGRIITFRGGGRSHPRLMVFFAAERLVGDAGAVAAAPPALVRDIDPAGSSDPYEITSVGRAVYFGATKDGTDATFIELGKSDGTSEANLTDVGGELYFSATDGTGAGGHGRELWKSDGTDAGTVAAGAALSFAADDGTTGMELWRRDP